MKQSICTVTCCHPTCIVACRCAALRVTPLLIVFTLIFQHFHLIIIIRIHPHGYLDMPPIDYSKWDNIDTDSEVDEEPPKPKTKPLSSPKIIPGSQTSSSSSKSSSDLIQAIKV